MVEIERVWMFHTGRARLRRGLLEAGAGSEVCWLPVLCFLLEHPDGPVLVDAGLGVATATWLGRGYGRLLAGMVGGGVGPGLDVRSGVRACGVDPDSVQRGLLTHLHWDHAEGVPDMTSTRFSVARRELEVVRRLTGLAALRAGYRPNGPAHSDRLEPVDYSAADGLSPFEAAHDVLGDGSIRMIPTPGHSVGHSSVLVRAEGGRQLLLTGDAAFTQGHVFGSVDLGLIPRRFATDLSHARLTLERLQTFVRQRPGLRVFTSHDPEQGDDVAARPVDLLAE